jgi:hypothetical protein
MGQAVGGWRPLKKDKLGTTFPPLQRLIVNPLVFPEIENAFFQVRE